MRLRFLLVLAMFLVLCPCAIATASLDIVVPQFEAFRQNDNVSLSFHVFNSTGYILEGGNVSCGLHLYNWTGREFTHVILGANGTEHFYYYSDTDKVGHYQYSIECASLAGEAGFSTGSFELTPSGSPGIDDGFPLGIIILLPFFVSLIFLFGAVHLGESHAVLKIFLFLFGIIPYWASMNFAVIVVMEYYPSLVMLVDAMTSTIFWTGCILFVLVSYFAIYTIIKIIDRIATNKEQRMSYNG